MMPQVSYGGFRRRRPRRRKPTGYAVGGTVTAAQGASAVSSAAGGTNVNNPVTISAALDARAKNPAHRIEDAPLLATRPPDAPTVPEETTGYARGGTVKKQGRGPRGDNEAKYIRKWTKGPKTGYLKNVSYFPVGYENKGYQEGGEVDDDDEEDQFDREDAALAQQERQREAELAQQEQLQEAESEDQPFRDGIDTPVEEGQQPQPAEQEADDDGGALVTGDEFDRSRNIYNRQPAGEDEAATVADAENAPPWRVAGGDDWRAPAQRLGYQPQGQQPDEGVTPKTGYQQPAQPDNQQGLLQRALDWGRKAFGLGGDNAAPADPMAAAAPAGVLPGQPPEAAPAQPAENTGAAFGQYPSPKTRQTQAPVSAATTPTPNIPQDAQTPLDQTVERPYVDVPARQTTLAGAKTGQEAFSTGAPPITKGGIPDTAASAGLGTTPGPAEPPRTGYAFTKGSVLDRLFNPAAPTAPAAPAQTTGQGGGMAGYVNGQPVPGTTAYSKQQMTDLINRAGSITAAFNGLPNDAERSNFLQALKPSYEALRGAMVQAARQNDFVGAMKIADQLGKLVPNGKTMEFMSTQDGRIYATVKPDGGGPATIFPMTAQQLKEFVGGSFSQFDFMAERGFEKVLQATGAPGLQAPGQRTGYNAGTPAPEQRAADNPFFQIAKQMPPPQMQQPGQPAGQQAPQKQLSPAQQKYQTEHAKWQDAKREDDYRAAAYRAYPYQGQEGQAERYYQMLKQRDVSNQLRSGNLAARQGGGQQWSPERQQLEQFKVWSANFRNMMTNAARYDATSGRQTVADMNNQVRQTIAELQNTQRGQASLERLQGTVAGRIISGYYKSVETQGARNPTEDEAAAFALARRAMQGGGNNDGWARMPQPNTASPTGPAATATQAPGPAAAAPAAATSTRRTINGVTYQHDGRGWKVIN